MTGDRRRYRWLVPQTLVALPLGFAVVAVPLAMAGLFRPLPVLVATAAAAAGLAALWGRAGVDLRARALVPVVIALVVVVAATAVNAKLSSQHVLVDRDPGVYTLTARWLADEHHLLIDASSPAFGADGDLRHHGFGFYPDAPGDRIYAQFLHLFPAALAVGDWVRGTFLLTKMNALIGGLALLAVFAFGSLLAGRWPALGAMLGLAVTLPFVHFARDTYSEPLTMALLFGGLALLWVARSSWSARRAFVAGLALGATCMTRIDSFVYLAPLATYLGFELLAAGRQPRDDRRRTDRFAAAAAAGIGLTAAVGVLDGLFFSRGYLEDHRSELLGAAGGVAVAAVLAVVALAVRGRVARGRRSSGAWLPAVANAVAGALVALAAFAYFVRPAVSTAVNRSDEWDTQHVASHQAAEGLPINGARTYAEESMQWLGWYLGPVALALGVIGAALLTRRVIRGDDRQALPFLLVFLAVSVLYLWRPSIYPDQIWAVRRFMPVVIPGLVVLCFWTISAAWHRVGASVPGRIAVVAVAAAAVVVPASHLGDLATQRGTQVPLAYELERLCDELPDRAAVVVDGELGLDNTFMQSVQIFCGVPVVAEPAGADAAAYGELERRVRERGRRLYALSRTGAPFEPVPSGSKQVLDVTYDVLERPLTRRPERVGQERLTVFVTPVPRGPDG